jgi:hypothetical protein
MTPGFAKPRSELPWLPYEEQDRVIINAHNFTSAETFDVNGKSPVSVWCPSRDTAGNGTTTLTDLVGSRSGTLTNMDPATDWVSDTSNGGVRALDLDGVNDFVSCSTTGMPTSQFSMSMWARLNANSNFAHFFVCSSGTGAPWQLRLNAFTQLPQFFVVTSGGGGNATVATTHTVGVWRHYVLAYDGSTIKLFIDGVEASSVAATGTISYSGASNLFFGRRVDGFPLNGRLDDMRLFDTGLVLADVSYLWNAGNGRGRVA